MLTLPEPYYRDEAVTIYHARCEDILPCLDLSEVAMVLADPPYGIGIQEKGGGVGSKGVDYGADRATERGLHYHPTQKPVALMKWVLGLAKLEPGALVLDPYTGSGPVLRACKDLGYRAIGIDSLEWCCERAAERCRQETLPLTPPGDAWSPSP